jgi:hypothetical protein
MRGLLEGLKGTWGRGAAGLALALVLLPAWVGCGGGPDRTKANLRFVNASAYAALDLRVGDSLRFGAVAYGTAPAYQEIDPDKTASSISRAGSATPLVSLTPTLTRKNHYTLLAWGTQGQLKTVLLDEDAAAPASGKAKLRVVNAAADAGAVDIYLGAESDNLLDAVALKSAAAVGALGEFATVNSGVWRLRVTAAGTKADLRLDVGALELASGATYTLVLTPAAGGVLVDGLLLQQQGALTAKPVTHARVRVVGALPGGGAVSAALGRTTLMAATASPAISSYVVVPAGDQTLVVSAGDLRLPETTVHLAAGSESTLLVHDATGVPAASWIVDDNRRPSAASSSKLRLVNGLAASGAALSLTVDAQPVASGIVPGTGSAAAEVASGSQVSLTVSAPGVGTPIFSASDQALLADGVYTLFVLGGPTPAGILRRDR